MVRKQHDLEIKQENKDKRQADSVIYLSIWCDPYHVLLHMKPKLNSSPPASHSSGFNIEMITIENRQ